MKFGCSFSLLILLFISLSSLTFAVLCPSGNIVAATDKFFNTTDVKKCSTCVTYSCMQVKNQTNSFYKGGCPEDFYNDCTDYRDHAEIIKTNGSNILEYSFKVNHMIYISGCSGYCNGTECIIKKDRKFIYDYSHHFIQIVNDVASRDEKDPEGLNGTVCDSNDNGDPNVKKNQNGGGDTSASKGQDGTMKNIGIFVIGFFFAAWIL